MVKIPPAEADNQVMVPGRGTDAAPLKSALRNSPEVGLIAPDSGALALSDAYARAATWQPSQPLSSRGLPG